ncbi:MAG: hypothetical protein KC613_21325 [Myxococcales bacterium]|nr:hypothetical protein [Myxococcales bacterium]MCB9525490.1 hypothetical protein [Myxococcales bacterium]
MGRWLLRGLHWAIILNFAFEMAYAGYMVFAVIKPEGHSGPLLAAAKTMPFELMVTRRLYAIEFWIATAGLAIYLALTEIGPRFKAERAAGR